jgi:hypothetical protein
LAAHVGGGNISQAAIGERQELIEGLISPVAPFAQKKGDVPFRGSQRMIHAGKLRTLPES